MNKLKPVAVLAALVLAQGALAGGGSNSNSNSKKGIDDKTTVTFPSTNITTVIDDSRVRAATIPVFAVPAVAPIGLPSAQVPGIPSVNVPILDLRRDGRIGKRSGDSALEVRGRTSEVGDLRGATADGTTEVRGSSGTSYQLNAQLPLANPFAPWKTNVPDFVPACQ
jgi:hypothetical protein